MINTNRWYAYDNGNTLGTRGSENGVILRDEVYDGGAHITLERDGYTPFAITCGCWDMCHTVFFRTEAEAQAGYEEIKDALVQLVNLSEELEDRPESEYHEHRIKAINAFVHRF